MNEDTKINKKALTIKLMIALVMIIFIVVAMVIKGKQEKAEAEIAENALNYNYSVSVNNDELFENLPPVPAAEDINPLDESALKAALSENSMLKLVPSVP